MANIYEVPDSIKVPLFNWNDLDKYEDEVSKFYYNLRTYLLDNENTKNVGKVIKFPVADGCAEYMVASMKPLTLIHLPLMDKWEFQYAHLLTPKEVNQKIESDEAMAKLFS